MKYYDFILKVFKLYSVFVPHKCILPLWKKLHKIKEKQKSRMCLTKTVQFLSPSLCSSQANIDLF